MHAAEQVSKRPLPRTAKRRSSDLFSPPRRPDSQEIGHHTARDADAGPACEEPVSEEQIRAALDNALNSPEFQSAPQLRAFLNFVVQAALNKNRQKIKGYTIAIEALGRPEDFNPVTDPIVRVEAARLRRRLAKFYDGSGGSEPVRITIPRGSYAPKFNNVEPVSIFEPTGTPLPGGKPETADKTLPPKQFRGFFGPLRDEEDDAATMFDGVPSLPHNQSLTQDEFQPSASPATANAQTDVDATLQPQPRPGVSIPLMVTIGLICFAGGYLAGVL
ncbi:MAG: hypothetical protein K5905_20140 [Roseibium sp.]|uniref:hypothetical protein n=1 Tax=Roseibium sp. TaxID=1936156 RepID=UPI00262AE155|nr:hypothetical protein [Roseibium sp.]MCV0427774.1 hypothetical protein [Roseibium sp.]